jgi:hypothetical protein
MIRAKKTEAEAFYKSIGYVDETSIALGKRLEPDNCTIAMVQFL